ncbi:hypothetical protein VT03_31260 [Planctomyces sp. SH-PL14]|nr:hypothetical protein VT03_31260 [Planctomyces sp. SH-PL14]
MATNAVAMPPCRSGGDHFAGNPHADDRGEWTVRARNRNPWWQTMTMTMTMTMTR